MRKAGADGRSRTCMARRPPPSRSGVSTVPPRRRGWASPARYRRSSTKLVEPRISGSESPGTAPTAVTRFAFSPRAVNTSMWARAQHPCCARSREAVKERRGTRSHRGTGHKKAPVRPHACRGSLPGRRAVFLRKPPSRCLEAYVIRCVAPASRCTSANRSRRRSVAAPRARGHRTDRRSAQRCTSLRSLSRSSPSRIARNAAVSFPPSTRTRPGGRQF